MGYRLFGAGTVIKGALASSLPSWCCWKLHAMQSVTDSTCCWCVVTCCLAGADRAQERTIADTKRPIAIPTEQEAVAPEAYPNPSEVSWWHGCGTAVHCAGE